MSQKSSVPQAIRFVSQVLKRDRLIPKIVRHEDTKKMKEKELNTPFSEIEFDFTLAVIGKKDAEDVVHRRRVEAA